MSIPAQQQTKACLQCGQDVPYSPHHPDSVYCSKTCAKRAKNRRHKYKQRALKRGATAVENFDPIAIFKRDRWTCQLCGRPTPRRRLGMHFHDSPTLDHIVPLSQGGPHHEVNVQLLCHRCNKLKGDGQQ